MVSLSQEILGHHSNARHQAETLCHQYHYVTPPQVWQGVRDESALANRADWLL